MVVILEKHVFLRHMERILSDFNKFEKVSIKKSILNFTINHEKSIYNYLKRLEKSGTLSTKQHKKIKAVGSRPGILYGLCKVHKAITDVCPPFIPILSAIGNPSYKLAKILLPKLSTINFNEFIAKDSFTFAEETVHQDSNFSWAASVLTHCLLIYPLKRPLIYLPIYFIILKMF